MTPTPLDVWVATLLAGALGGHPFLDLCIQSGIHHNVLGGVWYAAALFILWVRDTRAGQGSMRRRIVVTCLGSLIAIILTVLAGHVLRWQPPAHYPPLASQYSQAMGYDLNTNSFPSQSTALYTAVAAGVYSLDRFLGASLWVGVILLVALPRMYVGGHWVSDILVGVVCGLAGYASAHYVLESTLVPRLERIFQKATWLQVLGEALIFAWILQVALEFRDAVWVVNSLKFISRM